MKNRFTDFGAAIILAAVVLVQTVTATGRVIHFSGPLTAGGASFTATLTYDDAQAPSFTSPGRADYSSYTFEIVVSPGGATYHRDPSSTLTVYNDQTFGDAFLTSGTGAGYAGFNLTDGSGLVFNSATLPATPPPIASFSSTSVAVGGGTVLGSIALIGRQNAIVIPYLATAYKYQQFASADSFPANYQTSGFDDSGWSTGGAGFGSIGGCDLNSSTYVATNWDVFTQILLRKHFSLPSGASNLAIGVAIDNDVQVFINGADVSGGLQLHENCPTRASFVFQVPDNILNAGDNLLVVRGQDRGGSSYIDVQVEANLPPDPVTNTLDAGSGSLREAIVRANSHPGPDTIRFHIPGTGVQSIALASSLPQVTDQVVIDGYTQPGASPNALALGDNAVLLIELNGQGTADHGLVLLGGNSVVRGLVVNRFTDAGIVLETANGDTVQGNFIGTDPAGMAAEGNGSDGVYIASGAAPGTGNYNVIGGNTPAARNIISGNGRNGITFDRTTGSKVYGNYIGSDITGVSPLGNGGHGIKISGSTNNLVGGQLSGQGNIVAFNKGAGVCLESNEPSMPPSLGNAILSNSIFGNLKLGIDRSANGVLNGDGVTPNRVPAHPTPQSYPTNPDTLYAGQNYPLLYVAVPESTIIRGSIVSWPTTPLTIQVFSNPTGDASGCGQGQTLIGTTTVTTDALGNAVFSLTPSAPLQPGQYLSATSTDPGNNTSEFSPDLISGTKTKIYGPHYVVNTTLSGVPLHWSGGKASFQISNNVIANAPSLVPAIRSSFATWGTVSPIAYSEVQGPSQAVSAWGGNPDGINNVVWITGSNPDSTWEKITGAPAQAIAVTRVRYNALNGELTDADMALNAQYYTFTNVTTPTGLITAPKDMQDVTTHEAGHFSGLGDIYNPGYAPYIPFMGTGNDFVTMYGFIINDEITKRVLQSPDTAAIGYAYRNIPANRVDMVLVVDGSSTFAATYDGFTPSVAAASELITRMRAGDRVGVIQLPSSVIVGPQLATISDSASKAVIIAKIKAMVIGGTSAVGQGLQTGTSLLTGAAPVANHTRAMILLSAGEETSSPGALSTSVVQGLRSSLTPVFTLGFTGSSGQDVSSRLADSTGGAYFLAVDTTIDKVVQQIWVNLSGQQILADTSLASSSPGFQWQGGFQYQGGFQWQGGFQYQGGFQWQGGLVDPGTTTILPGFQWQGSTGVLAVVPPQDGLVLPPPNTWNSATLFTIPAPYAVIAPGNLASIPKPNPFFSDIQYVSGPTYNYYVIQNPKPGRWALIPGGATTNTSTSENLGLSITAIADVTMKVTFNKSYYLPGDQILVQASLTSGGSTPVQAAGASIPLAGIPITDATVNATITAPGGTKQTVSLVSTGGGAYSAKFTIPIAPGSYPITVNATGNIPGTTVVYNRQFSQSVFVQAPFQPDAVLFATNSIAIADSASINSGSVIVNNALPAKTLTPAAEMTLGQRVYTSGGYNLKANKIILGSGDKIQSNILYNKLTNNGATVGGTTTSSLQLPVVSAPPAFNTGTPGTKSVTVASNGQTTLTAGNYGTVTILDGGTLTFKGGTYNINYLLAGINTKILFAAQSEVRVAGQIVTVWNTTVAPAPGSGINATQIVFYVAGSDGPIFGLPKAVTIGPKSTVYANIYAKNGTLWLTAASTATGAFLAKDIIVGGQTQVNLRTAFAGVLRKNSDGEEAAATPDVPATFALDQNYPNPFNPATTITYKLPEQRDVTLVVYNILGQVVKSLVQNAQPAGSYEVRWDGTNDHGMGVSSGVYIYRLKAGDFVQSRKMMMLR